MRGMRKVGSRMGLVFLSAVFLLGAAEPSTNPNGVEPDSVMGKDGAPMILIPEGPFTMGTDDVGPGWHQGNPNEHPEHTVTLKGYYIDQFEVTIARYAKFLEATKYSTPPSWDDDAVMSAGDRPVVGVDWQDAKAYCTWAGERLPTEAEWEKGARGTDKRRFPWGDMQPFVDIANYNRGLWVSYPITLAPVTSGAEGMSIRHGLKNGGKSPYGLYHMAGNAAEWVADWYDREYYAKAPKENPTGPAEGEKKVLRGGSWGDPPRSIRVTARFSADPEFRDTSIGFRCAMDAPAK
ncbi:formylglycine-generating enzyme family protein [Nitrospira sp. Nam74]